RRPQAPASTGTGAASGEIPAPSGNAGPREDLEDSDAAGRDKPGSDTALIHYGAAGLFFLYLQEKYGGPETLAKKVHGPEHGIAGVLQALTDAGHIVTFPELFTQWAVANLADASTVGDPPHVYGYDSREVHDLRASTNALHELLPDLIPRLFQPGTRLRSFPAAGSTVL